MIELNLAILGLFFSMLFSGIEIALISANKLQIDVWIKQKYKLAKLTKFIIENKSKFLTVALIGTNLSNILASSFFTVYFINTYQNNILFLPKELFFLPIAFIILIFGEILPKTLIREYANIMLVILSPILYLFYILFYFVVQLFNKLNFSEKKHFLNKDTIIKEKQEEFQKVFEEIDDEESMEKEQQEIISNIFDFRYQSVKKVMTPLNDISAISDNSNLDDLVHKFIDSGHSKLPVYKDNLNTIIGVVYIYDIYLKPESLNEIVRDVLFVSSSKLIPDLMKQFKEKKHSIAIVRDKNKNTVGLITIEDIFEELFGDFEDEFDYQKLQSWINKDGSIITNAKIRIAEFNNKYNNLIPIGDYETIAGYIVNEIGRIPKKDEHLFLEIGHVIIKKATTRRVEQIQIFRTNPD